MSEWTSSSSSQTDSKIIAVGNVKGGVGKTTSAVNLVICEALNDAEVLLIDGDEQGTARAFTQLRAERLGVPGYTAVSLRGAEIRTQVPQLRNKYQRILIDVGGRDTASLRAALLQNSAGSRDMTHSAEASTRCCAKLRFATLP